MRRRFLFASALVSLTVTAPAAFADREITDEITTPVATSTAGDGGVPDNIVISVGGRVTLVPGATGVTIDSDNDVTNGGSIIIEGDDDGGVGIHAVGGNTGTITHTGLIQVIAETRASDTDDPADGLVDGPIAVGSNRVAILVDGAAVFTGDILASAGSTLTVIGNDSAGLRVLTGLDGDIDLAGIVRAIGDNSFGVEIRGDVSGDVDIDGRVEVQGEGSGGILIASDVDGAITIGATVNATAYRFLGRPVEETRNNLEAEDTADSASPVLINGNAAGGVFFSGFSADRPGTPSANITVRGSAPAAHILANASSGDIVLGEVVLEAIPDDPDTADVDESVAAELIGYALVNRGTLSSQGNLDAVNTVSLEVSGADGHTVSLTGGFLNDGTINGSAWQATSTGVLLGTGAIVPTFANAGDILIRTNNEGSTARGVYIDTGANVPMLVNSGTIDATTLNGGGAVAVTDLSNTLTLIENTGEIAAYHLNTLVGTDPQVDDLVAIDLSANTVGTTVRQYRATDAADDHVEELIGQVRFGSGDDVLQVESGVVSGDLSFGDGADQLMISGGNVSGALVDSDGNLAIEVDDAQLALAANTSANITTARFGDGSVIRFQIDDEAGTAANITASGDITFQSGSRVAATLANLIGDGATFVVVSANNLVIEESLDILQDTEAPWLYESNLEFDPNNANALILTLRRRTAAELGMNANQGAAYTAALEGWQTNEELGQAIASLLTQDEFFAAYDQLLPEYSASAIQFALAANDSAVGALANRLEAVRRSPEESGGLWVQEFGYFADRAGSAFGPGYRGHGIGVAVGFDRPVGPFYAVGLNLVGAASEVSEINGVDDPMSAMTAQVGTYAGARFGAFDLDAYAAVGYDRFEHNRRVLIGAFDASSTADWSGWHTSASARISRDLAMGDRWYVRPAFSVDYLRLSESGYTETGGGVGVDLTVGDRESSSFSGTGLLTLGARFENTNSWWSPSVRVGFRNEFGGGEAETAASFADFDDTFTLRSQSMPGTGAIFGFGVAAGSGYSTFSFDYDADVREDFIRHTARLVMRMVF
ncbi:autotransporter outer membrane beta-barrel domain-containing protein [Maricaulis sp.]|uniref:autotransporter family protein n=1 Tax=Maricaulis sp. TaxID=1486257 RepID=UPI002B26A87F|nr:autotransporter outer membrane beta-barrel domain-containing protein [Maricaulis sp.]